MFDQVPQRSHEFHIVRHFHRSPPNSAKLHSSNHSRHSQHLSPFLTMAHRFRILQHVSAFSVFFHISFQYYSYFSALLNVLHQVPPMFRSLTNFCISRRISKHPIGFTNAHECIRLFTAIYCILLLSIISQQLLALPTASCGCSQLLAVVRGL